MKKIAFFVLCSLFAFCGCGGGEKTPAEAPAEQPAEQPAEEPAAQPSESVADENFSQFDPPAAGEEYAVITTELGTIELRLFPQFAPKAVENFTKHAKDGYYDGLIFHRVVKDFVIQTGDPTGTGTGGESVWGQGFEIEPSLELRHYNGALGMARNTNDTSSNGSQFYVVQNNKLPEVLAADLNEMRNHLNEEIQEGAGVTIGDLFPEKVIDNYLELGGTPSLDFGYTLFGQVISGMDVVEAIGAVETAEPGVVDKPLEDVKVTKVEIKVY